MAKDDDAQGSQEPVDRKRDVRLVGLGVATVALLWFALGTCAACPSNFGSPRRRHPLILVIVISGLLGALIAAMALRHRSARH